MNVLTLSAGVLLALLPISLQFIVFSLILVQHRSAIVMIRLWSGLLCASAILYWISVLMHTLAGLMDPSLTPKLEAKLSLAKVVWNTFELLGGWWVFHFAPQALPDAAPQEKSHYGS